MKRTRLKNDPDFKANNALDIVAVLWRDSTLYIQQESHGEHYEISIIESVGLLIEEQEDKIVLAGDYLKDGLRRVIVIPKENIVSTKYCH